MTTDPPADPSPRALSESLAALAAQVADLRGQIRALNERLDQAGLHADLNLATRFEELAGTVADALDTASPRGPAAPYWIGLDRDTYHAQLADLLPVGRHRAPPALRRLPAARSAGPATSTPSGNCPPWPPNGTAPTAGPAPTWPGPWSSTTGGCPAPSAASPTSPAPACRNARHSAATATGLLVPDTANTCAAQDSRTRPGSLGPRGPGESQGTCHAGHRRAV